MSKTQGREFYCSWNKSTVDKQQVNILLVLRLYLCYNQKLHASEKTLSNFILNWEEPDWLYIKKYA
jgi:hypothetical protein